MGYPEKDCSVPNLVHGDKIASTTEQKLDAFTEQIKKVFSESVPHKNENFEKEIKVYMNENSHLFKPKQKVENFEEFIKDNEIEKIIKKLDIKKAPGIDNINNKFIRHLTSTLSPFLKYFFNLCLNYGIYPLAFKIAKMIMLHKPGKPANLTSSYRPLSLTSCLGKILEKWVADHISKWAEENKKFSRQQNGFRRNRSTNDNLFKLCHTITEGFRKKKKQLPFF